MSTLGKEYKLAIRIAGIIDKSFAASLTTANSTLTRNIAAINKDFVTLDKGFNNIVSVGKSCFNAIATAAGVATVAIGAAAAASISIGSEFEAQMSTVQAISGATTSELTQLSDKARELAQTSVFSAQEVGSAMEYMGMAGWKTEEILSGIEGVLDLAAASGEDFSMVSDIVTDDLTAFNMTASETQRMVDVMAQAAMNSNTNVEMMGETFKYAGAVAGALGYEIEDIAIATGLMASAGIKSSMAGTSLRNIMTRMAKPTKESKDAMDALGLSLEKSDGSMYSFLEIMQKVRESMSEMTKTQKAYYAAELAGQRGMTGLLAIANASDEEFKKLTDAIYNAEGAADKMASVRLDNLSGDVETFKDAVSDAGIELYYQFNDQLRGIVQFGTKAVNSAKVEIPQAFQKISAEFPTLQRKFRKYGEPVFGAITNAGQWIYNNGDSIISVIVGIGAALATYKIASTIVHTVNAVMSLSSMNPVTLGILGVVSAIGLLVTAFAQYKQHEQELVDKNLEEHFGNIALSMEEIQAVAEHIVSSDSLGGVKEALDAFEELDGISSTMENAVEEINKMNWKVSIGMELTEDEQEEYKTAIDEYVSSAKEYAQQSQYAVSLNLSLGFDENDLAKNNVVNKINQFYADKYDELSDLGTQLNEAVTNAFNDGLLDIKETQVIAEIQAQMAAIEESLATGEFDAQLSLLEMKYAGGGSLTADSFQNLQEELETQLNEATAAYEESYAKKYASAQAAYEAGDYLNYEEYQSALEGFREEYLQNIGELQAESVNFQLNTIMQQYADELDPAIEEYIQNIQKTIGDYTKVGEAAWTDTPGLMWNDMLQDIYNSDTLDETTRESISQLLEELAPTMEEAEGLAQQYKELGLEIPKSIQEGIDSYNLLNAISNKDTESINTILGEQIVNSEYYDSFYKDILGQISQDPMYDTIPEDVANGIATATADLTVDEINTAADTAVRPAVEGMYSLTQGFIDEFYSNGFTAKANVDITLNPAYDTTAGLNSYLSSGAGGILTKINQRANGGLATRPELTWFAEKGPEMAIPIDGSRNAISLWQQTGHLLGMDSVLDGISLDAGGSNTTIKYNPTLQFYGEAPSKTDLEDALRVSQDEFDSLMERYLKTHGRVAF